MNEIEQRVLAYLKSAVGELGGEPSLSSRLIDLGVDSFGLFDLLLGLEAEFNISIQDEDFSIATFRTVGDMANYVLGHQPDGA